MMDCTQIFKNSVKAGRTLSLLDEDKMNKVLLKLASYAVSETSFIISENAKDLELMDKADPRYDRLLLSPERLKSIAADLKTVASLPSPLGKVHSTRVRPNGLKISKISVPFGVVGVIYESRPNVTFDVFSLCFKSGNACILKGGSDAINSNNAIVKVIRTVLEEEGVDPDVITLLPAGRDETAQLLNAREYVDLIIPRGSRGSY